MSNTTEQADIDAVWQAGYDVADSYHKYDFLQGYISGLIVAALIAAVFLIF